MSTPYSSPFAAFISGLIATKRAAGYAYQNALSTNSTTSTDTQPFIPPADPSAESWSAAGPKPRTGSNPAVHRTRLSPIRELGKYMQSIGVADAFVLPTAGLRTAPGYVPHFFTEQELTAFFRACDKLQPNSAAQARHWSCRYSSDFCIAVA